MKAISIAISIAVCCCRVLQAHAVTDHLVHTFNDPTVAPGIGFGNDVAMDGSYVLIGDRSDINSPDLGQAHLIDAATGNLLRTFLTPTGTGGDSFGRAVAIDGNSLLIGAPEDDAHGRNAGRVHLFDATTGILLQSFTNPTGRAGGFGRSLAMDGKHILIGAHLDDSDGTNVGRAYLFDANTGNFLHTFIDPTPASRGFFSVGDNFGFSVAIDGNYVLVGAPLDSFTNFGEGQVHLFDATTGNLLQTINPPTTNSGRFGHSVALDGYNLLIGASVDDNNGNAVGRAHLFDATTGDLLQSFDDPTVTGGDQFGNSVDIDGKHVVIGAFLDDSYGTDVGQVHLFDAVTGNLLQTINDPSVTEDDLFGISVAVDGKRILIGDYNGGNVGQAHLFEIVPEPCMGYLLFWVGLFAIPRRNLPRITWC